MWGAIVGAVLGGISARNQQRSAERAQERQNQAELFAMREAGDEARRTAMFQSDLARYEQALDRERKRGGLANMVQFGKNSQGQNNWAFMDSYTPVTDTRETPVRPNYADYQYKEPTNG